MQARRGWDVQYCNLKVSSSGSGGVVLSSIFSTVLYTSISPLSIYIFLAVCIEAKIFYIFNCTVYVYLSSLHLHLPRRLHRSKEDIRTRTIWQWQFSPESKFWEGLHYVTRSKKKSSYKLQSLSSDQSLPYLFWQKLVFTLQIRDNSFWICTRKRIYIK